MNKDLLELNGWEDICKDKECAKKIEILHTHKFKMYKNIPLMCRRCHKEIKPIAQFIGNPDEGMQAWVVNIYYCLGCDSYIKKTIDFDFRGVARDLEYIIFLERYEESLNILKEAQEVVKNTFDLETRVYNHVSSIIKNELKNMVNKHFDDKWNSFDESLTRNEKDLMSKFSNLEKSHHENALLIKDMEKIIKAQNVRIDMLSKEINKKVDNKINQFSEKFTC